MARKKVRKSNNVESSNLNMYDSVDILSETGSASVARQIVNDAFRNPIARTGLGTQNLLSGTEYTYTRLSQNYNLLNNLYRSNWIVKNIVDVIPEDMCKTWFKPTGTLTPEQITKFNKVMFDSTLKDQILSGLKVGRLYGGAKGIILIDGQTDLSLPLDYSTITPDSFKGLYIVDRWSGIYPEIILTTDINSKNFGLPEYYYFTNDYNIKQVRVHYTRLVSFIGKELPRIEKIKEQYWGQSVLDSVYEELVKRDNVSNNIVSLTFRANRDVVERDNLDQLLATGNQVAKQRFYDTLQAQSVLSSNLGLHVINRGDKISQLTYNFAGLKDIYETVQQDVAGASNTPVFKLFGKSPSGLNATGKAETQAYYDRLNIERETNLYPIIRQLLPVIAMSAWGYIPDDLMFEFDPIRDPDELEKANIAQKKTATLNDTFSNNLIDAGTTLAELRDLSEVTGMYTHITDDMIEDGMGKYNSDINTVNDPISGVRNLSSSLMSKEKEPQNLSVAEFEETKNL